MNQHGDHEVLMLAIKKNPNVKDVTHMPSNNWFRCTAEKLCVMWKTHVGQTTFFTPLLLVLSARCYRSLSLPKSVLLQQTLVFNPI